MTTLTLVHEMSLAEYHDNKFPAWIANIPGEELLWLFSCDDQECEGSQSEVRVWRKLKRAA